MNEGAVCPVSVLLPSGLCLRLDAVQIMREKEHHTSQTRFDLSKTIEFEIYLSFSPCLDWNLPILLPVHVIKKSA